MLGNNFLCKLANNVKNLSKVFDEIYLADLSIIINKHYVIKMARRRRKLGGTPNVVVNQVAFHDGILKTRSFEKLLSALKISS